MIDTLLAWPLNSITNKYQRAQNYLYYRIEEFPLPIFSKWVISSFIKSKEEDKDQESIQSNTTPDSGHYIRHFYPQTDTLRLHLTLTLWVQCIVHLRSTF